MQVFRLGFDWNVNSLNLWRMSQVLFFKVHQSSYHHASDATKKAPAVMRVCVKGLKQLDLWDLTSHVHFVMLTLAVWWASFNNLIQAERYLRMYNIHYVLKQQCNSKVQ